MVRSQRWRGLSAIVGRSWKNNFEPWSCSARGIERHGKKKHGDRIGLSQIGIATYFPNPKDDMRQLADLLRVDSKT